MIRARQIRTIRIQPKTRLAIWIVASALACAGYGIQRLAVYGGEMDYAVICRYRLFPAYYAVHHSWPTSIEQPESEFEANRYADQDFPIEGNRQYAEDYRNHRPEIRAIAIDGNNALYEITFSQPRKVTMRVHADGE